MVIHMNSDRMAIDREMGGNNTYDVYLPDNVKNGRISLIFRESGGVTMIVTVTHPGHDVEQMIISKFCDGEYRVRYLAPGETERITVGI
jgi:hypothetical protein